MWIETLIGSGVSSQSFSIYVIRILLDGILPSFVLYDIAKKYTITLSDFVSILTYIVGIQFVVSVFMVISPEFKNLIFTYLNDYSSDSVLMYEHVFLVRGFGIAYTYLAWFPFTLALIFVFSLFSNSLKSSVFITLFLIATMLMIVMNARIGFIPIIIGILMYLFTSGLNGVKKIVIISVTFLSLIYAVSTLDVSSEVQARVDFIKKWVLDEGFSSLSSPGKSSTIKDLSNFSIISDFNTFDFMIGRGNLLSPLNGDLYTDVGYMQILFTGGFALSFVLYSLFGLFIIKLIRNINKLIFNKVIPKNYIYFPVVISLSFLIGHGKLRIFEMNEATRFLLLLTSFFIALNEINVKTD